MKYPLLLLCCIMLLCSCKNKAKEELVITQNLLLEDLEKYESWIWEAIERNFYDRDMKEHQYRQLLAYKEFFDENYPNLNNQIKDSINLIQKTIIEDFFISAYERDDEELLAQLILDVNFNVHDSVQYENLKIKYFKNHKDFLEIYLNHTIGISCSFGPVQHVIINQQDFIFNKGMNGEVEIILVDRDQIANIDSVFVGKIDTSRFDTAATYSHMYFNYIDLNDYSKPMTRIEKEYAADFGKARIQINTQKTGKYELNGVARKLIPLDRVEYVPFFFEYQIVDCN